MTICTNCIHCGEENTRAGSLDCWCTENVEEKFSPRSGPYSIIKDHFFFQKANEDGNCIWFIPIRKWWKFWGKRLKSEPFSRDNLDKFLAFMRDKYPEILFEYKFLGEKDQEVAVKHKVKPTPKPTCGINRIDKNLMIFLLGVVLGMFISVFIVLGSKLL